PGGGRHGIYGGGRLHRLWRLRDRQATARRAAALMAHQKVAKKVLVWVGGDATAPERVRLACRMTDTSGGKLYGVHIIEVNRSLPLGAVRDDVIERGEKILDEVELLASESTVPVETELVQARDTGPALVGEADEWG